MADLPQVASQDAPQAPPITPEDGLNLVKAVDSGSVKLNDLSPQGQLAYSVVKGTVDPKQLNATGLAIYNALQPKQVADSMSDHPILDAAEKTAELGGLVAGGMGGASAGALTSPVTGPVGPVAGGVMGAGLGYGAVKQGAHALNAALGYEPSGNLADETARTAAGVGEGSKMQLYGEGLSGAATAGLNAVKSAAPAVMDFLSSMSKRVAGKVMENPELLEKYQGTPAAITNAVQDVQQTLTEFKQKASDLYNEAMKDAGIRAPQTAVTHAQDLMDGSAKAMPLSKIGKTYLEIKQALSDDLDPTWILAKAEDLKQEINAHLKFNTSNVALEPIAKDTNAHLQSIKTDVMNIMQQLPDGQQVLDASKNWSLMHDMYDSVQGTLKDTGKAVENVKKIFSDDSQYYQSARNALQTIDQITGKPVGERLENEVTAHVAKQALPTNVMGKRQIIMAIAAMSPGRLATMPALMLSQSPAMVTKGALAARGGLQALAMPGVSSGLAGGVMQGASGVKDSEDNDVFSQ